MKCKDAIQYCSDHHNAAVSKKPNVFRMLLSKQRWALLVESTKTLDIVNAAMVRLQAPALTISDAYVIWQSTILRTTHSLNSTTSTIANVLGRNLIAHLNSRKDSLFATDSALSAAVLDPRIRRDLNADRLLKGRVHIMKLWRRISAFKAQIQEIASTTARSELNPMPLSDHELLDLFYESSNTEQNVNQPNISDGDDEILLELDKFVQTETGSKFSSSMEYWSSRKHDYPKLFTVAEYLNSIPPTQVTIERSFSTLSFIFGIRRCQLNDYMLENILLIKLNPEIVQRIFEKELQKLNDPESEELE